MDYDLIVVKTLERVYKNYYYIIRGDSIGQIYPKEQSGYFAQVYVENSDIAK